MKQIISRSDTNETYLKEKVINYSKTHFEDGGGINNAPIFVMFDLPPDDEKLGVLWSYRLILKGAYKVLKDRKIKKKASVKTMRKRIGNLIYGSGPMNKKNLNSIIVTKPHWKPEKQDLTDLVEIVDVMDNRPKPITRTPSAKFDLQVVTWALLANLAILMENLKKMARKLLHEIEE